MGRTSITVSAFLDQTRLAEGEPFLLGYVTFPWKKLAQTASFVPKNFENVGRRGAKRAGDRSSKILRHKRGTLNLGLGTMLVGR